MKDNVKTFFELLSKDEALRKKVCAMTELEEIIALAKELEIELSEADFETRDGELSEDELNAVAGGGDCYCLLGGGGTESNYDDVCACVVAGVGYYKDSFKPYSTADNLLRCVCSVLGDGYNGDDTAATWK